MADDWKRQLDALHSELVHRDDPAAWVTEADAVEASRRYPHIAVRGPVFGIAVQEPAVGARWRLLKPLVDGMPQQARDGLNSHLWFTAKDGTDDPGVRRELLAAVAVLEQEPVNEVEALGVRYRVVRGEEFARSDEEGALEPPRPTDREPAERSWEGRERGISPDEGFVLDPDRDDGMMAGAMKLALRGFVYAGTRFPEEVCAESRRAVETHPQVALLPVGFGVVERGGKGWRPCGVLRPSPHEARRLLHDAMTESWPLLYRFDDEKRARYAEAAAAFRAAGRADEARVDDRLFRICRIERMVRMGPDGPEPARPSDVDDYGPMRMHPAMDEDGTIHYDE
ncbi:DUF5954 family protein [Streptomyces sp. JJ38]|uniref:DUF5954 family protein n=1 Tax=Streptomyces sp. JJ38 TaxID=2738128 RepID=UPI001C58C45A|nr:DUF5954 family protein [Streptomyces sp. JJ38]MBW1600222.1 hypothetical protein [Streptomyces sp. JJ38]